MGRKCELEFPTQPLSRELVKEKKNEPKTFLNLYGTFHMKHFTDIWRKNK